VSGLASRAAVELGRSLAKFNGLVDGFVKRAEGELVKLQKRIVLEAFRRIVKRTPVDTGRTRGNWQITIGVVPTAEAAGTKLATAIGALTGLGPYQVVYITNNVPHIEVLEYGLFEPRDPGPSKDPRKGRKGRELVRAGFSVQAPQGMVRVTVVELEVMFA